MSSSILTFRATPKPICIALAVLDVSDILELQSIWSPWKVKNVPKFYFTCRPYLDRHNLRRIEKELKTRIEPIPKEVDAKLYVAEAQIVGNF